MRFLLLLVLALLLFSTDSPLQTSTVFSRDHYSLWIARVYGLSIISWADLLIVGILITNIFRLIALAKIPEFRWFFSILIFYLFLGGIQNLLDGGFLKPYLYDVKVVSCFAVGWLAGVELVNKYKIDSKIIGFLVATYFFGTITDYAFTILRDGCEYPSLFFKTPHIMFPLELLVVGIFLPQSRSMKYSSFLALFVEIFFAINRLSFGYLLNALNSFLFVLVVRVKKLNPFFLVMISIIFISLINFQLLQYFSDKGEFVKADGVKTRIAQLDNILADGWNGIPLLVGKGLGSPWHVSSEMPRDIYSTGMAMYEDIEKSANSDYQFVLNSHLGSLLHKWGLLGSALVALFCSKLLKFSSYIAKRDPQYAKRLEFYSVLISLFLINGLLYFGLLRYSLLIGAFLGIYSRIKQQALRSCFE